MAAKGENKNPKCATVIPSHWPRLTGPKATGRVNEDRSAWFRFLREQIKVGRNPTVYRGHGE